MASRVYPTRRRVDPPAPPRRRQRRAKAHELVIVVLEQGRLSRSRRSPRYPVRRDCLRRHCMSGRTANSSKRPHDDPRGNARRRLADLDDLLGGVVGVGTLGIEEYRPITSASRSALAVSALAIAASTPCSLMNSAHSTRESTISASGTTAMLRPFHEQMTSACCRRRSPGSSPPRLARAIDDAAHSSNWRGSCRSPKASIAHLATSITSISARPHEGQAMRSTFLRSRNPSDSSSWRPSRALPRRDVLA